ncbi:CsbD family protein [Serpentinicella sp. ANB-PHB4]|uniref:CsbD family protein n=1 Tax=Serpentinicella sp. ANB-PHB4 TaxID=3074076 RepID=UPI00285CC0E5|nr:CsbD family protein [Serpentinicella sp. ANB-PHB4]MDR5659634.1 CsbD family protein [Serpentinicella sp. ANB-PHB4]
MNKEILKGKWNQLKGSAKKKWGELTDDDLNQIEGSGEKLVGKIQEKYGKNLEEAEQEVELWLSENDDRGV